MLTRYFNKKRIKDLWQFASIKLEHNKESLKLNMILKFKKVKLSKQRTCMCIKIRESNKRDCFPLHYLKWFNVMVISVAPNYTAIRKNGSMV